MNYKNYLAKILLVFTLIFVTSCLILSKLKIEEDKFLKSKNIKLTSYFNAEEFDTPLSEQVKQIITKSVSKDSISPINVYDYIVLKEESFDLTNQVILILDSLKFTLVFKKVNKEPQKEPHVYLLIGNTKSNTIEKTYNAVSNKIIFKLNYVITKEIAENILKSEQIHLRYYSGPNAITLKPSKKYLQNLKQLIEYK